MGALVIEFSCYLARFEQQDETELEGKSISPTQGPLFLSATITPYHSEMALSIPPLSAPMQTTSSVVLT